MSNGQKWQTKGWRDVLNKNELILLYQLRERLRMVNERIMERKETVRENCNGGNARGNYLLCALASGALIELHSEALFLAGLIAAIEGEEVTLSSDS